MSERRASDARDIHNLQRTSKQHHNPVSQNRRATVPIPISVERVLNTIPNDLSTGASALIVSGLLVIIELRIIFDALSAACGIKQRIIDPLRGIIIAKVCLSFSVAFGPTRLRTTDDEHPSGRAEVPVIFPPQVHRQRLHFDRCFVCDWI